VRPAAFTDASARRKSRQRSAHPLLDRGTCKFTLALELLERSMHVSFAKTEAAQRPEGLGSCFEHLGPYDATVGAAVGVADAEGRCRAVDEQLAAMGGAVVGAAEGDEVLGVVGAAFGAELEMVDVDEGGIAATRDAAAAVVACEDGPAQRGWGGLLRAS